MVKVFVGNRLKQRVNLLALVVFLDRSLYMMYSLLFQSAQIILSLFLTCGTVQPWAHGWLQWRVGDTGEGRGHHRDVDAKTT